MKRYRLHTTGAGDGTYVTLGFPYTSWREAYKAAAIYSHDHGFCVVQSNKPIGPCGNKSLETIATFAYGLKLGQPKSPHNTKPGGPPSGLSSVLAPILTLCGHCGIT